MEERDFWTIQAMRNSGEIFIMSLGGTAYLCNPEQLAHIKGAFKGMWQLYEKRGLALEKKYKTPTFTPVENPVSNPGISCVPTGDK